MLKGILVVELISRLSVTIILITVNLILETVIHEKKIFIRNYKNSMIINKDIERMQKLKGAYVSMVSRPAQDVPKNPK